uniref:DNA-directed RNA polymerase subunit n=1 Tax=Callipsygma wilsonis TaxID=2320807 RepID=A0A386AZV7_9CHLO|nr:RNA polymerase b-subunit [Callipsygma wilsonis]AYC64980.1 RNA polymerase b-subunit [Callipsygma wilsonis]
MPKAGIRINLASNKSIKEWALKKLPNGKKIYGQILFPKTINYNTLIPDRDGLFCERIFGPVHDRICSCGLPPLGKSNFCPDCEVVYNSSRSRRYRLGYINLITAVAHLWFYKNYYFSLFLNLPIDKLGDLFYCNENIARIIFIKNTKYYNTEISPNLIRKSINKNKKKNKKFWYWESQEVHHIFVPFVQLIDFELKSYLFEKVLWKNGGIKDSSLYFGFSIIPRSFSWRFVNNFYCFLHFLIYNPKKKDRLNKFYPGPPGLIKLFNKKYGLFCLTNTQIIRSWLLELTYNNCSEAKLLEQQIRIELFGIKKKKKIFIYKTFLFRRLRYLKSFRHFKFNLDSMILLNLPVLPPDLRPILKLDKDQIITSDLNKLYLTILVRTERLSLLVHEFNLNCLTSEIFQHTQCLLQESVDSLIDNEDEEVRSLSSVFKGKTGRFRQNLLGKRVDYSARSVIVVGPYLKIYECGIPKNIAYEIFKPFLIRTLISRKITTTIFNAKNILKEKPDYIWTILQEITYSHPVLLNRAPTLHRLSIQTFQPRLVEGKAILLHPLVCTAFNADFDGDQMGVHLPLSFEARAEAWKLIWSQNNLFSLATSAPICSPSQDMILGSSALTIFKKEFCWITYNPFLNIFETEKKKQKLIEIRVNFKGYFHKFRSQFFQQYHSSGAEILRKIRTTPGRIKFYYL